jgi:hypothetical protein
VTKEGTKSIVVQPHLSLIVSNIQKVRRTLNWKQTPHRGMLNTFLPLLLKAMNGFHSCTLSAYIVDSKKW